LSIEILSLMAGSEWGFVTRADEWFDHGRPPPSSSGPLGHMGCAG